LGLGGGDSPSSQRRLPGPGSGSGAAQDGMDIDRASLPSFPNLPPPGLHNGDPSSRSEFEPARSSISHVDSPQLDHLTLVRVPSK
jgi:hypothetical protein